MTLTLGALLGKNMAQMRTRSFEPAAGGPFESLGRASVGLQFRHSLLLHLKVSDISNNFRISVLVRINDHHHLPPFEPRVLFHRSIFLQIGFDAFQKLNTELLMRHLSTTKTKRDLCLVTVFEESNQVSQFNPIVTDIRARSELNFLDLHLLLLSLRRVSALAFFILVFAEIHNPANRWRHVRGNLDQIQTRFFRFAQRIGRRNDTDLFTVVTDEANLRRVDTPVYSQLFVCRDVSSPPKY